ncbi:hypothetical protein RclHR1_01850019 [Rhizophagus clarus]|uniref:Uncharacterized protein n=1 Tax=Rhizophagus clarus TaxID=94130 RepID=A0A2Z6QZY2_9GLOM|nr:hypothetical protein RclHR1_01850019 [Rhizophagus clarus]GES92682.1 hypothetical protein GLOIN_2v1780589 [Rhizophagus clarus]
MSRNKVDNLFTFYLNNYGQKKIDEFFSFFRDITHENKDFDYDDEIFVPPSPSKEQETYHHNYIEDSEYFDKLIDRVDLIYIGRENDLASPRPKSEIPAVYGWDSL